MTSTPSDSPSYYLASADDSGFAQPRSCWPIRILRSEHRTDLVLVRISPPLTFRGKLLNELVLASRHVGYSLLTITEWPVYVHVAVLLVPNCDQDQTLRTADLFNLAWAEIYPSEAEARRAVQS